MLRSRWKDPLTALSRLLIEDATNTPSVFREGRMIDVRHGDMRQDPRSALIGREIGQRTLWEVLRRLIGGESG